MSLTKARQLFLPVTWLGLAMIGMLWFGIWYQVQSEFDNARLNAERDLNNYSRVFDEHIARTIKELDKGLLIARRRYLAARENMSYEEAISYKLPDPALLSDMSFQMATIDRNGLLTATTIGEHPPKPIDLKDRKHFQVHIGRRPDKPYISVPVLGRRSGRWSVQLTRRIEGKNGSFDGVLVASMDPAHFGRFYGSIDFGSDDAVIFAGDDGYVRVSSGTKRLKLGDKIEAGNLLQLAVQGHGVHRGDMDGSGIDRLFAIRRLENYPLFVAVGTSYNALFAAAKSNRTRYIATGVLISLLILLGIQASIRHHRTLARMAQYDDLTGLANRALFRTSLNTAVSEAQNGRKISLFLFDIDNFKAVNDTFGHAVGDKLLITVGQRLRKNLRKTDLLARLGGDEFAILLKDIKEYSKLAKRAEEILEMIREPLMINGRRLNITASIGSAIVACPSDTPECLYKNADLALYYAKARGRNCHKAFQVEMAEQFAEKRQLDEDLHNALDLGQLEIFYQPVNSLEGDDIYGFEALLRWNHPEKGCISPKNFIPIAEENGLIIPIGEWVLKTACKDAMDFASDKKVAVNLSPVQFRDADLVGKIATVLHKTGLPAERLELEITESLMMNADDETIKKIRQMRDLGASIAMDDFGTGYSSLGYLCSFEFDRIKIDRSFIVGLDQHSNYAAVIRTIVDLAKSLGVRTTAEGVETIKQLEMVRAMGCTEVQGYLFSHPKPLAQIRHLTNPFPSMKPQRINAEETSEACADQQSKVETVAEAAPEETAGTDTDSTERVLRSAG